VRRAQQKTRGYGAEVQSWPWPCETALGFLDVTWVLRSEMGPIRSD
jgi:hypothetical protein